MGHPLLPPRRAAGGSICRVNVAMASLWGVRCGCGGRMVRMVRDEIPSIQCIAQRLLHEDSAEPGTATRRPRMKIVAGENRFLARLVLQF
jgi:hypothetical protein